MLTKVIAILYFFHDTFSSYPIIWLKNPIIVIVVVWRAGNFFQSKQSINMGHEFSG